MNKVYQILLIGILVVSFGILVISCNEKKETKILESKVEFNQELVDELSKMAVIDQLAASNAHPPENYSHLTQEQWESFTDSVFTKNQKRIGEIFNKYGFLGYDLVGKGGSFDFWLITQHSDHNPEFQQKVLEKMKIEVDRNNADPKNYAMLVDRVKINTGQEQIYGSQVLFNIEIAQAYPKKLFDSVNVNKRRKSIGLEPIEVYLNEMTQINFEMNKQVLLDKGITEPKLYKIE